MKIEQQVWLFIHSDKASAEEVVKLEEQLRERDDKIIELTESNHTLETSMGELRMRLQELAKKILRL